MQWIHAADYTDMSLKAAELVAALVQRGDRCVLGLPTGKTPLGLYRELAARRLDWRGVATFNLDEYVGLSPEHPASFRSFMRRNLFDLCAQPPRWAIPDGSAPDLTAECLRYEAALAEAGPIDLLILGLGRNGHIGFNEPGSPLDSATRVVTLSAETRAVNRSDFPADEAVPARAITMGIGTMLKARRILLLAGGAEKAPALAAALSGPVTPAVPASALQLHPDVIVLADAAASG
ncbi:MAG TPA: glucosamine-6-phosphate deaminase [Symbiobacteriaceae bacterium]|jgi:glucosamine-6-phosphate deaminase